MEAEPAQCPSLPHCIYCGNTYMPNWRQHLGARVLHWYPFASGCGALANHKLVDFLLGRSDETVWARTPSGRLRVSLADFVGKAAYYVGDLDPKVSWIVNRLVSPGDTVLDIGANVGVVALQMARRVGGAGRVHAFEPNPAVASLLTQSLAENRLTQVTLHQYGLGAASGSFQLNVPSRNAGAASFVRGRGQSSAVNVPVRTLDDVAVDHGISRIDFIKMDVEGFEADVVRGAGRVLSRLRPKAVLFELNEPGVDPNDTAVVGAFKQLGYRLFTLPRCWFRVRANIHSSRRDSAPSNDFLAVPEESFERTATLIRAVA